MALQGGLIEAAPDETAPVIRFYKPFYQPTDPGLADHGLVGCVI